VIPSPKVGHNTTALNEKLIATSKEETAMARNDEHSPEVRERVQEVMQQIQESIAEASQDFIGRPNDETTQQEIAETVRETINVRPSLSYVDYVNQSIPNHPPRTYMRDTDFRRVGLGIGDNDGDGMRHYIPVSNFVVEENRRLGVHTTGFDELARLQTQENISRRFYEALERRQQERAERAQLEETQFAETTIGDMVEETPIAQAQPATPEQQVEMLEERRDSLVQVRRDIFVEMDAVNRRLHDLRVETEHMVDPRLVEELEAQYRDLEFKV
jgi:hypothetical protein